MKEKPPSEKLPDEEPLQDFKKMSKDSMSSVKPIKETASRGGPVGRQENLSEIDRDPTDDELKEEEEE